MNIGYIIAIVFAAAWLVLAIIDKVAKEREKRRIAELKAARENADSTDISDIIL